MARSKPEPRWIWRQKEWPTFTWNERILSKALASARRIQGEVIGRAKLLDPTLDLAAHAEILALDSLSTSAIEGEQIEINSLRSSIAKRLGLPTVGLPATTRHVEGLIEVLLAATQNHGKPLTLARLCAWQAALFPTGHSGLHKIRVGKLRGAAPMRIVSGPIGRERIHYKSPSLSILKPEVTQFLRWFNNSPPDLDGLIRAGIAHLWFELLHPFEDGNGRVGRALMDMALAQDEGRTMRLYSLSARFMHTRDEYYTALGNASTGTMDITPWLLWFLTQVEAAARASEATIAHVLSKARFWLRHAATELNARQRKALNRMLDTGPGGFIGGMTNEKYRHLTKTSPATAQRDLANLVEKDCLMLNSAGRSVRYEIFLLAT